MTINPSSKYYTHIAQFITHTTDIYIAAAYLTNPFGTLPKVIKSLRVLIAQYISLKTAKFDIFSLRKIWG